MSEKLPTVVMYTDGACIGNPGPGGYGVVLLKEKHRKELSGGFRLTTNNRMELMAAIMGLRALKQKCAVTIHTDSQYLSNGMTKKWVETWKRKGWRTKGKKKVLNRDLWEEISDLCAQHQVGFVWVKGHAGVVENERCDVLSMSGAQAGELLIDETYENLSAQPPDSSIPSPKEPKKDALNGLPLFE